MNDTSSFDEFGFLDCLSQRTSALLDDLCNSAAVKPAPAASLPPPQQQQFLPNHVARNTALARPSVKTTTILPTKRPRPPNNPPPCRPTTFTKKTAHTIVPKPNPATRQPRRRLLSTDCKVKRDGPNVLFHWMWVCDGSDFDGGILRDQKEIFDAIDEVIPNPSTKINTTGQKIVLAPLDCDVLLALVDLLAVAKGLRELSRKEGSACISICSKNERSIWLMDGNSNVTGLIGPSHRRLHEFVNEVRALIRRLNASVDPGDVTTQPLTTARPATTTSSTVAVPPPPQRVTNAPPPAPTSSSANTKPTVPAAQSVVTTTRTLTRPFGPPAQERKPLNQIHTNPTLSHSNSASSLRNPQQRPLPQPQAVKAHSSSSSRTVPPPQVKPSMPQNRVPPAKPQPQQFKRKYPSELATTGQTNKSTTINQPIGNKRIRTDLPVRNLSNLSTAFQPQGKAPSAIQVPINSNVHKPTNTTIAPTTATKPTTNTSGPQRQLPPQLALQHSVPASRTNATTPHPPLPTVQQPCKPIPSTSSSRSGPLPPPSAKAKVPLPFQWPTTKPLAKVIKPTINPPPKAPAPHYQPKQTLPIPPPEFPKQLILQSEKEANPNNNREKQPPECTGKQSSTTTNVLCDLPLQSPVQPKQLLCSPTDSSGTTECTEQNKDLPPSYEKETRPWLEECEVITAPNLSCIVYNASTTARTCRNFLREWRKQPRWAWCLIYSSPKLKDMEEQEEDAFTYIPNAFVIEGLAICWSNDKVFALDLQRHNKETYQTRLNFVRKMFARPQVEKILFDMKPHIKILFSHDIKLVAPFSDPKIAAWLLEPEYNKEKSLLQLVTEFGKRKGDDSLYGAPIIFNNGLSFLKGRPKASPLERSYLRAHQSWLLMNMASEDMKQDKKVRELFEQVEMPILILLSEMEYCGIGYDDELLQSYKAPINAKLDVLQNAANKILAPHLPAGKTLSLGDPAEVSEMLFDCLGLPTDGVLQPSDGGGKPSPKKKRKLHPSTSASILQKLAEIHELPRIILEHRKLSHTVNTYIDPFPQFSLVDKRFTIDGTTPMRRVYSTCLQTSAATGRLAFTDPNLQSISHEYSFVPVHDPSTQIQVSVRNAFVAQHGSMLVSFDYSQLELRIMAQYSKDPILTKILTTGGDVFKALAAAWLEKGEDEVTPLERNHAKHIIYGILYGMGTTALAEELNISRGEAKSFVHSFKRKYEGVTKCIQHHLEICRKEGYVRTLMGRKRPLPAIVSEDFTERSAAERQAINTMCQGSAADLVKVAMIKVDKELKKQNHTDVRLLVQLHDELLYEVPEHKVAAMKDLIRGIMERAVKKVDIPLPVNVSCGKRWGSLEAT